MTPSGFPCRTGSPYYMEKLAFSALIKGCVRYIFASLFLMLKESACETRKNVSYFTSKPLFVLCENQILEF